MIYIYVYISYMIGNSSIGYNSNRSCIKNNVIVMFF